jgi:hypothetical protein
MRRSHAAAAFAALLLGTACGGPAPKAIPWQDAAAVSSQELSVLYGVDACQDLDHVEVEYEVRVIVVTVFATANGKRCTGLHFVRSVPLPLHEPLGGREVRDGAK